MNQDEQLKHDLWRHKLQEEARLKADSAYNKGLLSGLGFFHAYLYPILKRGG